MNVSNEIELGIVEYRQLIKIIHDLFGYDFSDHALTSLKRRFESFIARHNLKHSEGLIDRLKESPDFYEIFMSEILVGSTEMFRDPTFWSFLRDEFFPGVVKDNTLKIKVWLPEVVSGDELFTLMIVLKESGYEDKVDVIASAPVSKLIEDVKSGAFLTYKYESSRDNYARYQGIADFSKYLNLRNEKYSRDISLIKNVKFLKQNINFDNQQQDIKLILYRNKLIYFNQGTQDKVLKKLHDSLIGNGFLVIGNKEQLGLMYSKNFRLVNEAENVFKRL